MSLKALSDYTFISKYSRYNAALGRRETWEEAVSRVEQMHLAKYSYANIDELIRWAFDRVREKRVLGSQRALQYGGDPILKNNARAFNCSASYVDRVRFFQEAFWLLLSGCGVGFSVQKHHVRRLPPFRAKPDPSRSFIHVAEDSIEGWADCLGVLLSTYMIHEDYEDTNLGNYVEFDFSQIRPKGSAVSSGVGKAPGPEPLALAMEHVRSLLDRTVAKRERLRPIDAYDIIMHASDAVLSGGVRRSACIALFSPDDTDMLFAKTGNWHEENPQRARSNNSAVLLRSECSKEDFLNFIESIKEFGEPGFSLTDSTESVYNPCHEVNLYPRALSSGETGFAFCNLCEINGAAIESRDDFIEAARAAAIIGTLQAGYTSFPYLGEVSEEIAEQEALLGVSITGMMDNPSLLFVPEYQREAAEEIKAVNKEVAELIGINQGARLTVVKPAGTTSCILGSASGIHPHHAKRYLRRVQANELETPLQFFKDKNPHAVEKSAWSANHTDEVITFCIEAPEESKVKNDLSAIEMLKLVKLTKENWIDSGKVVERCAQPWLSHNVSNTVIVRPDEWEAVAEYIFENRESFAGISLLPSSGDMDYKQAPNVAVLTEEEIVSEYGKSQFERGKEILEQAACFGRHSVDLWTACDAVLDRGPAPSSIQQSNWILDAKIFARDYFRGDLKAMILLLKKIKVLEIWNTINRNLVEVDYSLMREDTDNTKFGEEVACAGGACEIFTSTPV